MKILPQPRSRRRLRKWVKRRPENKLGAAANPGGTGWAIARAVLGADSIRVSDPPHGAACERERGVAPRGFYSRDGGELLGGKGQRDHTGETFRLAQKNRQAGSNRLPVAGRVLQTPSEDGGRGWRLA